MVYHKHYISEIEDKLRQTHLSHFKDHDINMSVQTLKFDLARMEAKLDIITNLLLSNSTATSKDILSQDVKVSAAELSLLRTMTSKQHVTSQLLIEGWSNKSIAEVLNIGENTVKLHVRAVCKKVGTKTRGQAALVLNDIFERVDSTDYQKSSGGLPVDWARNLEIGNDPHAAIYRRETE
jgi:DNA-binding CsgD family transcriptional regulator